MKFTKLILSAALLFGFAACSNDGDDNAQVDKGYLTFEVSAVEDVENITRAQITIDEATGGYTVPAAADFTITILDEDGYQAWKGKIGEWDSAATPLKVGTYTVKAEYDNGRSGFDKPVFAGQTTFTIVGAQETAVKIPVTLQNAIVRFTYSDMFLKYYSFNKVNVTSGSTSIEFTKDVNKGAFIDATTFNVATTFTSQSGKSVDFSKEYSAKAATCYTVAFDASNIGGVGTITITLNDEVTEVDMGEIELNE
jgi:hypothetical protein